MKGNLVHSYVCGDRFKSILGGKFSSFFGSITHIKYMSPLMEQKWPYIKNLWQLSSAQGSIGYFKTLKEAKTTALETWPTCYFKTPSQFRKECYE